MSDLPTLPDMIDPEARHVEFRATQCEECRECGPITTVENPEWWQWGDQHNSETGHRKIYQWTLTRNRGEITTVGTALRAPKRRTLGNRGA
jgi:hypothetical protein